MCVSVISVSIGAKSSKRNPNVRERVLESASTVFWHRNIDAVPTLLPGRRRRPGVLDAPITAVAASLHILRTTGIAGSNPCAFTTLAQP